MKFITEYDLRTQFNARPYTDYHVEEGTRLTPGARQFLADRGINLFADGTSMHVGEESPAVPQAAACPAPEPQAQALPDISRLKLAAQVDTLAAEFLCISADIVAGDVSAAQTVAGLGRRVSAMRSLIMGQTVPQEASRPEETQGGKDLEITDFFIQSPHGCVIVRLNLLRARLRELRLAAAEVFSDSADEARLQALDGEVTAVIAALSSAINEEAGV
jgi:ethanolamine utilization cobalamin adenosyltransferase